MHRCADAAAEDAGLRDLRRLDVCHRSAGRDVPAVRQPVGGVQSRLLGVRAGDVDDRWHRALDLPGDRSVPAWRDPAVAGGHHLVGGQRAGARRHAGAVRGRRTPGYHRPGPPARRRARARRYMTSPDQADAPLLRIDTVTKRFGGFVALDNISIDIRSGERFGLIGPNGSGKTTLINCISGALRAEVGTVVFAGEDITRLPAHMRTRRGIARSFQIPRPFKSMTVAENLMVAVDFATVAEGFVSAAQRRDGVMSILTRTGLASKADVSATKLSQVELRKMELARAMATRP